MVTDDWTPIKQHWSSFGHFQNHAILNEPCYKELPYYSVFQSFGDNDEITELEWLCETNVIVEDFLLELDLSL